MTNDKYIKEAEFVKERIEALREFRKNSGIEDVWKRADDALKIKPIGNNWGKNYRNRKVALRSDDWQSDNSDLTPFQKVHIALSVLAEQNPRAIFTSNVRGRQALSVFHQELYNYSLKNEMFKFKLARYIYNQGKYGIAFSCTKPRHDTRTVRDLVAVDGEGKETYKDQETQTFKGAWFKVLNPWQCYWDDSAEVFDKWSLNDWCYYDYLTKEQIEKQYPKVDITKFEETQPKDDDGVKAKRKGTYKVYYYENKEKDLMVIYSNDKVLDAYPIPTDKHDISFNYSPWFLRDDVQLPGVGIPEILMQDKNLLDKINNMSVDQLVLSIYKTYFYDGTNDEDGVLTLSPGRGQQVLDPSKVKFLEVPGNGGEIYKKEELIRESMDANTFSKTLGGEAQGKTAYEIEQIKNASIRRLASPLDGLKFGLTTDAYTRMDIIHSFTTNAEVEEITDPDEAEAALAVYKNNPEAFKFDEENAIIYRYKYEEVPMKLKKEGEEYLPSEDTNFFMLTPEGVRFDGDIDFDIQSVLLPSPELEKMQITELTNLVVPLFKLPPEIALKPAKQLIRKYNQDFKDWFPDAWLQENPINPLVPPETAPNEATGAMDKPQTVVPPDESTKKTTTGFLANLFGRASK